MLTETETDKGEMLDPLLTETDRDRDREGWSATDRQTETTFYWCSAVTTASLA